MNSLYMMITITERSQARKFAALYKEVGLDISMTTIGMGTARSDILDYFGLEGSEKSVFFHIITGEKWREIKRLLQTKIKIDIPGIGIAFTIPLSSIGGKKALSYLTDGQNFVLGEESSLKETKSELLIVIANQGYSEMIMDAARKVHASGGTVIHAKGTGTDKAEKFLGVTLVPEKEMVFIVARSEEKNAIMRSIMDEAGVGTKAGSIVFSLPVSDTAGMRLLEDNIEEAVE